MSDYSDAVLALSPDSYWRFEGASPLADLGSAGITLTAVNAPTRVPSIIPCETGEADGAYMLNTASTQYFHAGDNYDFSAAADWCILQWARFPSDFGSSFRRLFEKRDVAGGNAGYRVYGVGTSPNMQQRYEVDPGGGAGGEDGANTSETPNFVAGQVHMSAMSYTTSDGRVHYYRDGINLAFWPATFTPGASTANLCFGASSAGGNQWDGEMDDIAVWEGTIPDDTDIADLWTIGSTVPEKQSFFMSRRRSVGRR